MVLQDEQDPVGPWGFGICSLLGSNVWDRAGGCCNVLVIRCLNGSQGTLSPF